MKEGTLLHKILRKNFFKKKSQKILSFLYCLVFFTTAFLNLLYAQPTSQNTDHIYLAPYTTYYVDSELQTDGLTPESALEKIKKIYNAGKFKPGKVNFGVNRFKLWAVYNGPWLHDKGRKFFVFHSEQVEYTDIYFIYKDLTWKHYHYDPEISYYNRVIPYRKLIFPIDNYQNVERIFFSIKSDQNIMAATSIVNETDLLENQTFDIFINGAFYGILFALLIYNAFLLLFVGNRNYLYFILFGVSHLLVQATIDGFLHQYILPDSYISARDFRVFMITATIFSYSLFTIHFMEVKNYSRWLYRVLLIQSILGFVHLPLYFLFGFYDSIWIATPFILSGTLLAFITGIYLFKKNEMAPYYIVASLPMLVTFILIGLRPFNIEWAMTYGSIILKISLIIEMLALSIALGQKFKILRNTITEKENELLKVKMNNLKNKLRPHFIMNTLGIALMFVKKESKKAEDLLKYLVHTFKYLLQFSDSDLVPLSDEIEFTRSYAGILKHKHSSTLSIDFDIIGSVQKISIPPFTLQPLVENAYIHGVRAIERGKIDIKIYIVKDSVEIRVTNSSDSTPLRKDLFENTTIGSVKKRLGMTYKNSKMTIEKKGESTMALVYFDATS